MDDIWRCTDCPVTIHRHPDPAHESQAWTERFIAEHEAVHTAQLEEHEGDRDALRRRLRTPALHAALNAADPIDREEINDGRHPME